MAEIKKIVASNALEAATAIILAKEGISLDQEDKERLKFVDDACGEIFSQAGVEDMPDEEVHKLVTEVMNASVSDVIKHILDKYELPHIFGYAIANKHMEITSEIQNNQNRRSM